MMVQDLINDVLFYLREPGSNFGGAPNPNPAADYNAPTILAKLNDGLRAFVRDSNYTPDLSDTRVVLPITAGQDFQLPANLVSLYRVEYSIAGDAFQVLPELSFDAFDDSVGFEQVSQMQGAPTEYRQAYGTNPGSIRWNPIPNAGNVAAGDMVTLYYMADPLVLVNLTDVPAIPVDFHEALSHFALSRLWFRKNDPTYAKQFLDLYQEAVKKAIALPFNANQGESYAFIDVDDTVEGVPTDSFGSF